GTSRTREAAAARARDTRRRWARSRGRRARSPGGPARARSARAAGRAPRSLGARARRPNTRRATLPVSDGPPERRPEARERVTGGDAADHGEEQTDVEQVGEQRRPEI